MDTNKFNPNLQFFIDLGFYTVPIHSKILRDDKGKKILGGIGIEKGFKQKYTKQFNTQDAQSGFVLTGKLSNVLVVDCDNKKSFDELSRLDCNYDFKAVSEGKEGGAFFYVYNDKFKNGFSLLKDSFKLEVMSNKNTYLLPTIGNKTKYFLGSRESKLKEIPPQVEEFLLILKSQSLIRKESDVKKLSKPSRFFLSDLITDFLSDNSGSINETLFKFITPKIFRDLDFYKENGYLDPKEIKEGSRSIYLSRVSAILGSDESVDIKQYTEMMIKINSMILNPLDEDYFFSTIINPMVEGKSTIDDIVIWKYNEEWKKQSFVFKSKIGEWVTIFFDDVKNMYYVIKTIDNTYQEFKNLSSLTQYIQTINPTPIIPSYVIRKIPLIRTVNNPIDDWGLNEINNFNLFNTNKFLTTLQKGGKKNYKYPEYINSFMYSLIPDRFFRNFILKFIKTKLTRFEYSPLILYFVGVAGSGKDVFCEILRKIVGYDAVKKIPSKVFLEKNNSWISDTLFAQLDEYAETLRGGGDRSQALGILKNYSGSNSVLIRRMGENTFVNKHNCSFICTSNTNTLPIQEDDRRFVIVPTTKKLVDNDFVNKVGFYNFFDRLYSDEEVDNFCMYLHKEVDMLNSLEYTTPPKNSFKSELIIEGLNAIDKIIFGLKERNFKFFYDEFKNYNLVFEDGEPFCIQGWSEGRFYLNFLYLFYNKITEGNSKENVFKKYISDFVRSENLKMNRTTKQLNNYLDLGLYGFGSGDHKYYLYFEDLKNFYEDVCTKDLILNKLKINK